MVIDVHQGSKDELGFNDTEQDAVSKSSHKQDVGREIDKIGRKRDNPNNTNNAERARKEDDECGSDEAMMTKPQTISPKPNKKIKMESDRTKSREKTRSKTRLKTPQQSKITKRIDIPPPYMFQTYKIATLNIHGIASKTKMSMLADFLKRQT
jgi:hypothetical protein